MPARNVRWVASATVATCASLVLGGELVQCASRDSAAPDAGASLDAGVSADVVGEGALDARGDRDGGALCDGGNVSLSDSPGWRRLTEFDPCCKTDVPLDPVAQLPRFEWIPCLSGAPNCRELKTGWPETSPPFRFRFVRAARDSVGDATLFAFRRALSGIEFEDDVYDLRNGAPLGGWKTYESCFALPSIAGDGATVFGRAFDDQLYAAHGSVSALITTPTFQRIATNVGNGLQTELSSETTFAFDIEPAGIIGRWQIGSPAYQASRIGGLLLDLVERDDVFARAQQSTSGWTEEYRVDSDGSVHLYFSKPNVHGLRFRTDGTTMFWTEASGDMNPRAPTFPVLEVWAAPYTSDAAQLASTARRVAILPGGAGFPHYAVAFNGLYAVNASAGSVAHVVRLSDGAVQTLSAPAGWGWSELALVTQTELWGTMSIVNGRDGSALVRVALTDW